jgi:hypothetical protein
MRIFAIFVCASLVFLYFDRRTQATEDWEAKLSGAWTLPDNKCDEIFVHKGGRLAFRQPVDMFGPSFIVEGREIRGPEATCRIIKAATHEDMVSLVISCRDAVSFTQNAVQLRFKTANEVERLFPGPPDMAVAYEKCSD